MGDCSQQIQIESVKQVIEDSIKVEARRHDLDALRAFAMLLGILLHGIMSFIPGARFFWAVEDSQTSPIYGIVLASIHGWRMPLFFLVSGYFTSMLWRKRGLKSLLIHRFQRIFLPLLLSMVTVVPLLITVSGYLQSQNSVATLAQSGDESSEARSMDYVTKPSDLNVWAAVATGDVSGLKSYLDQGGNVEAKDPYGSTPLHVACLFGQSRPAKLLLDANANLEALNAEGKKPEEHLQLDWGTTAFIAQLVQLPVEREALLAGREEIARAFTERTGRTISATTADSTDASDGKMLPESMFNVPVFFHLWFLWFLCWYVCGFALIVTVAQSLNIPTIPTKWLTSWWRHLWLIPAASLPQYFMASGQYAYGPDTAVGLLPLPAVFAYYAVFFGYGVLYFGANDENTSVGRGFWWKLAAGVLILFPIGLSLQGAQSIGERILFSVMQVSYAWLMSFSMIGLFHRYCQNHSDWIRYLSDSSYWLYLVHIPLLMAFQFVARDWPAPSLLKFCFIFLVTTLLLLLSYQWFVRGTWIGVLLNGKRAPRQVILPPQQAITTRTTSG